MTNNPSTNFEHMEREGIKYINIKVLEDTGLVKAKFSTRVGGVSGHPYNGLNLGVYKDDSVGNILENYRLFCKATGFKLSRFALSHQTHTSNVYEVTKKDLGKGLLRSSDIVDVDALTTNEKGVVLATFYADCVPIYFLDTVKKAIASVHSGWKGTLKGIALETIKKMNQVYNTNPKDVMVAIGPSISYCCFEIGYEVYKEFKDNFEDIGEYSRKVNDKYYVDLKECNKRMLQRAGIDDGNIFISDECTVCNNDLYYSYRADKGKNGIMCAAMELI